MGTNPELGMRWTPCTCPISIDFSLWFPHFPSVTISRHFHGWDASPLPSAIAILTRPWAEMGFQGPLDLRGLLVLVPTRHAGRRLRAELARFAAEKKSAVLAGAIVTPEHLIPPRPEAASDLLALAVLARLLCDRHADLPALFPVAGADWSFAFALGIARQLQDVRRQLAAANRSAADLVPLAAAEDQDRWSAISRLEQDLIQHLSRLGRPDPLQALRQAAITPPPSFPFSRIASLFIPDLPPVATCALQTLSASLPVDIHLSAPPSEADRFDIFGRPVPDQWEQESLPFGQTQIHVFDQAPDETDALADLLIAANHNHRALAVCTPDPDHARALERRLQMSGHPLYLPNGIPLESTSPGRLLSAWLALLRQRDYASTAAFLRHPDAQDGLLHRLGLDDASALLSALDQCQADHLPTSFHDLLAFARSSDPDGPLAAALDFLLARFDDPIASFLADLYEWRAPSPDPLFVQAAQAVSDLLRSSDDTARLLHLSPADALDLLRCALSLQQVFPKPNSSALPETLGWLEVQWDSSPILLLADMREGVIPETRIGDAFLPDSLRQTAGLPGNREAFARDLFLARALLASRPPGGVRFLYSRRAANQDPQLPSRILLACPPDELPARIDLLFGQPALRAPRPDAPPLPALRLTPPACPPSLIPSRISVTAFRSYLACPFRFYLSQVLRMRPQDDGARELDPSGFGTLAHEALHLLASTPSLDDETQLQSLLLAELDRLARRQFGPLPSFALQIQLDSLRQRLCAAAHLHAASVREGWRIVAAEETFEAPLDGMLLRARIDRIDRHLHDGRIRILDYKTTDAGPAPNETHYQSRNKEWIDLQLPLYRFLYEQRHPDAAVSVGYFNLPKAVANAGISELDFASRDGDLYPSALQTARDVIARIQSGLFWPPAPVRPDADDFSLLFSGGDDLLQEPSAP